MIIEKALADWQLNSGSDDTVARAVEDALKLKFPSDYLDFMHRHDGGEGFLGDNYLILWKLSELELFNREYEVHQYAPGLLLFGSDGGGEGYGFDLRTSRMSIVRVPFIGMDLKHATPVADNFEHLIAQLSTR